MLRLGHSLPTVCLADKQHNPRYYPTITEPPAGQLRLASAATTNFTSSLLTSAAGLFRSSYFGTGGDEINANCYDKDPQTQADLR